MQLDQSSLLSNPRLVQAARTLQRADLFTGLSDNAPLVEKQWLFLVIAGCKPVGEATSGHWEETTDGRQAAADDPDRVAQFLNDLGLQHEVRHDQFGTDPVVSLEASLLLEYARATDATRVGELFGYPVSATTAYESGTLMPISNQIELEERLGLRATYFRFSSQCWREEAEVARTWWHTLAPLNWTVTIWPRDPPTGLTGFEDPFAGWVSPLNAFARAVSAYVRDPGPLGLVVFLLSEH